MFKSKILLLFTLFFLGVMPFDVSYANFMDTYGISPSGMARGNAMVAVADDWSSVYYNMAGLGKTRGQGKTPNQLSVTYMYNSTSMDVSRKIDETPDVNAFVLGAAFDINQIYKMPEIVSSARFGIGLGILDDLTIAKVNDIDVRTHKFLRYGRDVSRIGIFTGVGFGFSDDTFGIGFGATILAKGGGNIVIKGINITDSQVLPGSEIRLDIKPEIAPVLGVYWNVDEDIGIGASYRGELMVDIDSIEAYAELTITSVALEVGLAVIDFYVPEMYSIGTAYSIDDLTISFDLEFQNWSGYKVSILKENFWAANNLPIPEFDDIIIPKIGLLYKASENLDLLAGYYYRETFVPDGANKGPYNFLDNDTHALSFGAEFTIEPFAGFVHPVKLGFGVVYQRLEERNVVKDYSYLDAYVDAGFIDEDERAAAMAVNPNYTYGGDAFMASFQATFVW